MNPMYKVPPIPTTRVGKDLIPREPRTVIPRTSNTDIPKPTEVRTVLEVRSVFLEEEVKNLRSSLESFLQAIKDRDTREMGNFAESIAAAADNLERLSTFVPGTLPEIELPEIDLGPLRESLSEISAKLDGLQTTLINLPAPTINMPTPPVEEDPLTVDYEHDSAGRVSRIFETYRDHRCITSFERDSKGRILRESSLEVPLMAEV